MVETIEIPLNFNLTKFNLFIYPNVQPIHYNILLLNKLTLLQEQNKSGLLGISKNLNLKSLSTPEVLVTLTYDIVSVNYEKAEFKSKVLSSQFGKPGVLDYLVNLYKSTKNVYENNGGNFNVQGQSMGQSQGQNNQENTSTSTSTSTPLTKNFKQFINPDLVDTNIRVKTPRSSVKGEKLHLCGKCLDNRKLYFVIKGSDGSNWAYHYGRHNHGNGHHGHGHHGMNNNNNSVLGQQSSSTPCLPMQQINRSRLNLNLSAQSLLDRYKVRYFRGMIWFFRVFSKVFLRFP